MYPSSVDSRQTRMGPLRGTAASKWHSTIAWTSRERCFEKRFERRFAALPLPAPGLAAGTEVAETDWRQPTAASQAACASSAGTAAMSRDAPKKLSAASGA